MATCVGCSQEIPATASFCPRCGTPNPEARTIPTPPDVSPFSEQIPASELAVRLQAALGTDYVVGQVLGEGGFAHVFGVQDKKLSRAIAVKVLRAELTVSPTSVQRFVREAEAAAHLNHPHILPIFFVGEGEGLVYFGMPMIEGETLDGLLAREGRLSEREVIRISSEIADALAEAHGQGLVHRDVKPANVMLHGSRRRTLVTDFGIAKAAAQQGGKLTGTGVVIGSPHYMSPEQAGGSPTVDHRSDIYSLGVVMWQMLAGAVPFDAPDSQGVLVQQITKPLPPIRTRRPEVSAELARVIERCCAKRPEQRYQSAADLADTLRSLYAAAARPALRLTRRNAKILAAAALVGLGALAGGLALLKGRGEPGPGEAGAGAADSARSSAPSLAVLPFKVPTSLAQTTDGPAVAQLLANAVGEAFGVATVDMNRLLGRWTAEGRDVDAPLDTNASFAYALGANQLAVGRAFVAGSLVRLAVDLYDTRTLQRLGHSEQTGAPDSLFPLVDRLAGQVARTFCRQPEFNPQNLCFDTPPRATDSLVVAFALPPESAAVAPSFYVLVTSAGTVADVRDRQSTSVPGLMQAALSVVRAARYAPARKGRSSVEAWTAADVAVRSPSAAGSEVATLAGCDQQEASLRNAGRQCWDTRPVPRAALELPAPPMCPALPSPVTVVVRVSAAGSVVGQPAVVSGSNCDPFSQMAAAYLVDVSFSPALRGGAPVEAWTQVLVRPVALEGTP
jgi:hypothetical protein